MWFILTAAIVFTILIFSFGKNRKQSRYRKEGKNNSSDPGSDGADDGGSVAGSSW